MKQFIMKDFSPSCNTLIKVNGENKIQDTFKWILFNEPPKNFSSKIEFNCN